ncbi:MAG: hypothetical protein EAZ08_03565 [Cytophagales bacterium]|nr:MAG: hypothetical protein EAZ08_03565 [Cytophagales bacterium]
MKKHTLLFVFVLSCFLAACTLTAEVSASLTSLLTANGGKWKVSYAKFGSEDAPSGMYDRFLVEFKSGTAYITTNPDGAIFPALLPSGVWKEGSAGTLIFDVSVNVREITKSRTPTKIVLEWDVTIPGKVTTTYRVELTKAN